jgi:hypothetical protein
VGRKIGTSKFGTSAVPELGKLWVS